MAAEMSEQDIQKAILDWLNVVVGIRAWRRNTGAFTAQHNGRTRFVRFNQSGMADIWGIARDGVHVECEVKQPGQNCTVAQLIFLREAQDAGAIVFVAHSLREACYQLQAAYAERAWTWNRRWNV